MPDVVVVLGSEKPTLEFSLSCANFMRISFDIFNATLKMVGFQEDVSVTPMCS
jgi:hypothetical protein